tara:strand:+ start:8401 stop:9096 length:696 start_codon:yes stop_codon:yes gene_type:complete
MNKEECVLTLTNKGYIKYTKNLINSINKNNIDLNLFIYTMDQHSFNYFKKLNENVFLIEGLNTKKFLKQNSPEFGNYMLEKIKIIHQALQTFESVIYLDGDIVIKKNFLNHLSHYEKDYDLLIQDDKNPKKPHIEYLCAGFMKINSNTKTVNFFDSKNISKEMIMTGLHDQQYINENKNKLNYFKLPLDLYPNGAHFYLNHDSIDPYIIHFNYVLGNEKRKLMKKYGEWYK